MSEWTLEEAVKDGRGVPHLGYLALIFGIPAEALEDPEGSSARETPGEAQDKVLRILATKRLYEDAQRAHARPGGPRTADEWSAWLLDAMGAANLEARLQWNAHLKAGTEEPPS